MGWPEIELAERSRIGIAKASGVLNCLCVLPSLVVLSVGAYIQAAIQEKIGLVEGFNGDILPSFMIIFGFIGAFVGLFSGKVCWTNHLRSKRLLWSKYLLPLTIVELFLAIFVFVAGIMCFAQIAMLETSFERGISSAMLNYKRDTLKKSEVDNLQIEYQCCGSKSYTDWFRVSWIHVDYLTEAKKKMMSTNEGGDYLNDDVPFSCCKSDVLRPCVHHHVHDNDLHFNYDYRASLTLHTTGCTDALMDIYGNRILTDVGTTVLLASFLQLVTVILMRLLQTSVDGSLESGDLEGPSTAYIFSCGKRAIKAIKKEVKTFHRKDKDKDTTEPLLDNMEDDQSEYISDSSFDDDYLYEEPVPAHQESNPYMTINSAEMINNAVQPHYTDFPPVGSQLGVQHQQSSGHTATSGNPNAQMVTGAYPSGHYEVINYPSGQMATHGYPSSQQAVYEQYQTESNPMEGITDQRLSSTYVSPRRTHTDVNELPQRMSSSHMSPYRAHKYVNEMSQE